MAIELKHKDVVRFVFLTCLLHHAGEFVKDLVMLDALMLCVAKVNFLVVDDDIQEDQSYDQQ
jgi:hypothetical protein